MVWSYVLVFRVLSPYVYGASGPGRWGMEEVGGHPGTGHIPCHTGMARFRVDVPVRIDTDAAVCLNDNLH